MRLPLVIVTLLAAAATAPRYVPATGWRDNDWAATFYENWFGGQLRAMDEPPLAGPADLDGHRRRFRLVVLPTFQPAYAYRIDEEPDGRATLRQVELDGRGGYAPGRIAKESSRALRRDEVRRIERAIAQAGLDRLPRQAPKPPADSGVIRVCADGTAFVFERLDDGGRVFLARICGVDEKPLRVLIRAVASLDPRWVKPR